MKIARTGRLRNAGTDILSSQAFSDIRATSRRPKWNQSSKSVSVEVTGADRGNNYVFSVNLPTSEIITLIEAALDAACESRAERTLSASAISTIQALLSELNKT